MEKRPGILVVDSGEDYQWMIKIMLADLEVRLYFATDADEAFVHLSHQQIDLIISEGKWFNYFQEISKTIPIIVVSGSFKFSEEIMKEQGAVAFMAKPFSLLDFYKLVQRHLPR